MGTPEFACASLEAIIASDFAEVVAVVTVPDKPAGRGQQLRFSEVKNTALKHNLPVLQPEKLKDEQFIEQLKQYNADVFVVVAFRILPEMVPGRRRARLRPRGTRARAAYAGGYHRRGLRAPRRGPI